MLLKFKMYIDLAFSARRSDCPFIRLSVRIKGIVSFQSKQFYVMRISVKPKLFKLVLEVSGGSRWEAGRKNSTSAFLIVLYPQSCFIKIALLSIRGKRMVLNNNGLLIMRILYFKDFIAN